MKEINPTQQPSNKRLLVSKSVAHLSTILVLFIAILMGEVSLMAETVSIRYDEMTVWDEIDADGDGYYTGTGSDGSFRVEYTVDLAASILSGTWYEKIYIKPTSASQYTLIAESDPYTISGRAVWRQDQSVYIPTSGLSKGAYDFKIEVWEQGSSTYRYVRFSLSALSAKPLESPVADGSARPDLTVATSDASESQAIEGNPITLTYTVKNIGQASAAASVLQVQISPGYDADEHDDIVLGTIAVKALAAGASETVSITTVMPNLGSGVYSFYLLGQVDLNDVVNESNEANFFGRPTPLQGQDAQVPAPVLSSAGAATVISGQPFSYQIVANNNPTSYGASGLPNGLTINTTSGLISGTPTVTGTFTINLSASNAGGTGTKALVLTVNAANVSPSFSQHPANATLLSGSAVTFIAAASGTPTPALVWQRSVDGGSSWGNLTGGNGFSGVTTGTLQLTGVTAAMSGHKFRLTASNTAGSASSQPATLTVNPLVVSASAGSNGSLNPSGSINKDAGASQVFTATPNPGYQVDQWLVNGGAVQTGGTTFTLNNIQANQTVTVTFKSVSYTISATAGASGIISPSGAVSKSAGSSQTFTAAPVTGYTVDQWSLNGSVVQTGGASYTLNNIQANQTLTVTFKAVTTSYTITTSAGANGSVSPNGSISKDAGTSQAFTATPNTGYQVDQWLVNGGAVQTGGTTFTLNSIQANQTVSVSFKTVSGTGRSLKVVSTTTTAGSQVVVPVQFIALGDENAIGFSLTFDASKLSNPRVSLGNSLPAGVTLNANTLQAANGKLGVALALNAGLSFGNATYTLVNITFETAGGLSGVESVLTFGNQPIAREVANAAANSLPTDYISGTVTFTSGYEADVAPQQNGNGDGNISITDWVRIGNFVAGLDVPAIGSEFQRADVAPIDTRGDGRLTIGDWVLAGRYVAGLEAVVAAGGPVAPSPALSSFGLASTGNSDRKLRLEGRQVLGGQTFEIPVTMQALGGENAMGFSIQFDPTVMTLVAVEAGSATTGAPLIVNDQQKAAGKVGILAGAAAGYALTAGTQEVARLRFQATTVLSSGSLVSFGDLPVSRGVSDPMGAPLTTSFEGTTITVVSSRLQAAAGQTAQGVKAEGYRLAIETMAGKSYRVEWSADLQQWNVLGTFTGTGAVHEQLDVAAKSAPHRFYRVVEN